MLLKLETSKLTKRKLNFFKENLTFVGSVNLEIFIIQNDFTSLEILFRDFSIEFSKAEYLLRKSPKPSLLKKFSDISSLDCQLSNILFLNGNKSFKSWKFNNLVIFSEISRLTSIHLI